MADGNMRLLLQGMVIFASGMLAVTVQGEDFVNDLTTASSTFSHALYKAINKPNMVYSPYSIHSALTVTSTGARGKTLEEMRSVLGLTNMADNDVRTAYKDLIDQDRYPRTL